MFFRVFLLAKEKTKEVGDGGFILCCLNKAQKD